jgi:homoserine O-acetyltransferase
MDSVSIYRLKEIMLQSGQLLPDVELVYKTYGTLNRNKDNVVLYSTRFGGTHIDNEYLIGEGKALDPNKYFIIVPNMFGNGLSSSPSNVGADFPNFTIYDNVLLQHKLVTEVLGIDRIKLAVGWSMGAQQAYQWACLFPSMIERLAPIAGSAKTSVHNYVFLEGMRAALTADSAWNNGSYAAPPIRGLKALGRAWAGWALSHAFYREEKFKELGYPTLERFLIDYWEAIYLTRDANNILAMIWTWKHADLSANPIFNGDYGKALAAIEAKTLVMPGKTDMYFPPEDSAIEVGHMWNADLRVIPSVWGHYAGGKINPADVEFVDNNLKELLAI